MRIYTGDCEHGECGLPTDMVDSQGDRLFVGDVVVMASCDKRGISSFYSLTVVVEGRPELSGGDENTPFIMGVKSVDVNEDPNWMVCKLKSYKDCIVGESWPSFGFSYKAS